MSARGQGLERTVERLREIAELLSDPELAEQRAEAMAREAADLVSRAGAEIERAAREDAER